MGAQFVRGSTMSLRNTSSMVPAAFPMMIGGWFKIRTSDANEHTAWAYGDGTNQYVCAKSTGNEWYFQIPGVGTLATLTGLFTADKWTYILARFVASGNYRFSGWCIETGKYFTASSTNTNTLTATTISIGAQQNGTTNPGDLDCAEFWWAGPNFFTTGDLTYDIHTNIALTGPFGANWRLSPNIMGYWSFWAGHLNYDENEQYMSKFLRKQWTESATRPRVGPHPPISFPRYDIRVPGRQYFHVAAAAAGVQRIYNLASTGAGY